MSLPTSAQRTPFSARAVSAMREANWLRRERAIRWSAALLIEQVLLFAYLVLQAHGIIGRGQSPFVLDYPSFYGAGTLVLAGTPELAYDKAAHWHAEQMAAGADTPYNYFFYPPPFLLLCAAMACLPYKVSFLLFEATTLALYVLVVRRIASVGGWGWCVVAIAFPAVFWTIGLGQNAFLTAAVFGAGTLLLDGQPLRSGALLGLLCYKPHFGLLLPVALAAGGRWRAFIGAGISLVIVVAGSLTLFGVGTWRVYLQAFAASGDVYTSGKIMLAGYVTTFGAARLITLSSDTAIALQIATGVSSGVVVAWIWYREASLSVRSAALIAGTLLSVPVALVYDLLLISVCIAWLVRHARKSGFLAWEKLLLALLYLISLISLFVGVALQVPIGPLAPAIVLMLCVRHAVRETSAPASLGSTSLSPIC